jgi:adenylate cyclase class IV
MDYSIRIPATPGRLEILEVKSLSQTPLPQLVDYLYKPVDKKLSDFPPDKICIRLRKFLNSNKPCTLEIIKTTKTESGYTDEKEKLGQGKFEDLQRLAKNHNYEQWGSLKTQSIEYKLENSTVLMQNLSPIGQYLKIESDTDEGLRNTLKLLHAKKTEGIRKNAASLLFSFQSKN